MPQLTMLESIQLIPVLELEPGKFSIDVRKSPSGTIVDAPDGWFRYWSDSLADSGITGLQAIRHGSWHVPTKNFDNPRNLQRFLEKTFEDWGGIDVLSDPDCNPFLHGGLALRCSMKNVLIEPGCCSDLAGAKDWQNAAAYRGSDWQMLWIGHPWLSVRYQSSWLVVSEPHESSTPSSRWAVLPEELNRAVEDAKTELERFAGEISRILPILGYREDAAVMSRRLCGLSE